MAAVEASKFRETFPEFADADKFPRAVVDERLILASQFVAAADRWGDALAMGQMLWAAHMIALWRQGFDAANAGGTPGQMRGVISQESVDKVSVSYDVGAGTVEGAGDMNLTTYGAEYMRLANLVGAGPVQIGASGVTSPLSSAAAFNGFWVYNNPNPSG